MTPDLIQSLFTRPDGQFLCARWGRPIAPVVFGTDDATLATVKGAIEALARIARLETAETDPELGANFMLFFFRDWEELAGVPDLDRVIPDLAALCARLAAAGANQYRIFRFDEAGAIRAVFTFLRVDDHLAAMPAADLALVQAAEALLTWGEGAFRKLAPLAQSEAGDIFLHPELATLIRVAYDPALPHKATDASHSLRLAARFAAALGETGTPGTGAGSDA